MITTHDSIEQKFMYLDSACETTKLNNVSNCLLLAGINRGQCLMLFTTHNEMLTSYTAIIIHQIT
jgi:hypothetical protein